MPEFGSGSYWRAFSITVLTSSGNGSGGGDICCPVNQDKNWNGKVLDNCTFETNLYYPNIIGTWADDRIVTAGDYMDEGLFLTEEQLAQYRVNSEHSDKIDVPTFYQYADDFFEDISTKIIVVLCCDKRLRDEFIWLYTYDGYLDCHPKALTAICDKWKIFDKKAKKKIAEVMNKKEGSNCG